MARILLAEGDFHYGFALQEQLRNAKYRTLGPFADLAALLRAIKSQSFDLAVLDVKLGGASVFAAAEQLRKSGIPIVFLTSRGGLKIPEGLHEIPILPKPHDIGELTAIIELLLKRSKSVHRAPP